MGDVLISLNNEEEEYLRKLAFLKYEGKKGSLSQVVKDALKTVEEQEKNNAGEELMALLKKADYKLQKYKNRSELYD